MSDLAPKQRAEAGIGESALTKFWPVIVALAVGIAAILVVFIREIRAAIEVWDSSTAYSHCYLVLPMAFYLLWERRGLLVRARAKPDVRFALAAIPLTMLWLVAERLGIMEVRQLTVVAGVEVLFLTVLGGHLFRRISGPLLFLFFLVPFGAFLTPALQQFTATFTIVGLDVLGIANFSDRFTIETPAGIFFVAEACAGLRFLIAAIAFGVFYSIISYTSINRRVIFIGASIIVPVIANGFRALGIVVLGQVLGSAEAAAADHLIYGWVFFSAVMLMLIAGGHAFRDAEPAFVLEENPTAAPSSRVLVWCVVGVVVLLGFGPAVGGAIDSTLSLPTLPEVDLIVAPAGCSLSNRATAFSVQSRVSLISCGRDHFDVSVDAFPARSTSSGMIAKRRRVTQEVGAENSAVSILDLPNGIGQWTIVQTTDPDRVTAYSSWVDGTPLASGIAGRIAQARDSIFGAAFFPVLITITAAEPANSPPGQRRATLERLIALLHEQSSLNDKITALTRL